MNEILKEFLKKDIARDIYFIPCSIDEKEINDFIEQMQNKAIERGTTPTLNSYHHTLASEFLGKGVIIAFEFQGIEGALKFMIDTTIKAQEKMINDNIENGYLDILKLNKENLNNSIQFLRDGIGRIEKILKEME